VVADAQGIPMHSQRLARREYRLECRHVSEASAFKFARPLLPPLARCCCWFRYSMANTLLFELRVRCFSGPDAERVFPLLVANPRTVQLCSCRPRELKLAPGFIADRAVSGQEPRCWSQKSPISAKTSCGSAANGSMKDIRMARHLRRRHSA
jgi:hypothetical protein